MRLLVGRFGSPSIPRSAIFARRWVLLTLLLRHLDLLAQKLKRETDLRGICFKLFGTLPNMIQSFLSASDFRTWFMPTGRIRTSMEPILE